MPSKPAGRPQTLRQAKRAYLKTGGKTHPSPSELALIERRAVLQERADRIKEREARRKANIVKREERKERELERLRKLGREKEAEALMSKGAGSRAWRVGPSQLDLGRFVFNKSRNEGLHRREDKVEGGRDRVKEEEEEEEEEHGDDMPSAQPQAKRRKMDPPPRPVLGNGKQEVLESEDRSIAPSINFTPDTRHVSEDVLEQASTVTDHDLKESKQHTTTMTERPFASPANDEMADLFVSNTQIERELTPPSGSMQCPESDVAVLNPSLDIKPDNISDPEITTLPIVAILATESDELFAHFCTQDLDFTGGFTQAPASMKNIQESRPDRKVDDDLPPNPQTDETTKGDQDLHLLDILTQDLDFDYVPTQHEVLTDVAAPDRCLSNGHHQKAPFITQCTGKKATSPTKTPDTSFSFTFTPCGSQSSDRITDHDLESLLVEAEYRMSSSGGQGQLLEGFG